MELGSAGDLHGGAAVDVYVRHQVAGRRVVKLLERRRSCPEADILLRRDELPHVAWRRARWNAMHRAWCFCTRSRISFRPRRPGTWRCVTYPALIQRPDAGSLTGRPWSFAIKRFVALPVVTVRAR